MTSLEDTQHLSRCVSAELLNLRGVGVIILAWCEAAGGIAAQHLSFQTRSRGEDERVATD